MAILEPTWYFVILQIVATDLAIPRYVLEAPTQGRRWPCSVTMRELDCSGLGLRNVSDVSVYLKRGVPFQVFNFSNNDLISFDSFYFSNLSLGRELLLDFSYNNINESSVKIPLADKFDKFVLDLSHNAFEGSVTLDYISDFSNAILGHSDVIPESTLRLNYNKVTETIFGFDDSHALNRSLKVTIDLQDNQLALLRPTYDSNISSLIQLQVHLKGNPLNCDCHLGWIFEQNLFSMTNLIKAICQQPPNFQNHNLLNLSNSELVCVLRPDLGETLTVGCPGLTTGYVEWIISRVNDLNKSTSLTMRSDGGLVIQNMSPHWEGNYSCRILTVRYELTVSLDPFLTTLPGPTFGNLTISDPSGENGPVITIPVILVVILSILLAIMCFMYYQSNKTTSATLKSETAPLSEASLKLDATGVDASVTQLKQHSDGVQKPSAKPLTAKGWGLKDKVHYQNDFLLNKGRRRERAVAGPGKAKSSHNGAYAISVPYYNVPEGGTNRQLDSQLDYDYVDHFGSLAINIHKKN